MAETAASIGQQGGAFLGGLLNPIIGAKTETTVTQKPSSSSSSTTIIIVVVVVAVIAVIGYLITKKSS